MPVEDEYGRRQITQQPQVLPQSQQNVQHPPQPCPNIACIPSTSSDHRYASDKNLLNPNSVVYSDRFHSERSSSDRLPSGERYQGVSERYPLGERPQTSVSSERLLQNPTSDDGGFVASNDRYSHYGFVCPQRYPERITPVGSLDRYHSHNTINQYSRASTPTYHEVPKEKPSASEMYYHQQENFTTNERHNSAQSICSIDRYTPTERHRKRSISSDRKQQQQYQQYATYEPYSFPPIPCPVRFATNEFTQVPSSYMEPPSPAPASDRFVPPPPLSPDTTPSPDCFPNNAFPSPTTNAPQAEQFIPPPPLSPSPTEKYAPKKQQKVRYDRYDGNRTTNLYYTDNDQFAHINDSFINVTDTYIPPNAHMPIDRYIPQPQPPQDQYYGGAYQYHERPYQKFPATVNASSNDPYTRRDLLHNPRLMYPKMRYSHVGTPSRIQCCQYLDGYHLTNSSPGSSSSSSVTSQGACPKQQSDMVVVPCVPNTSLHKQEMQCQSYQTTMYHQLEKGTQCGNGKECVSFVQQNLRKQQQQQQCLHTCVSPSVEYVGASGGRHVCATPPPRSSASSDICNENCCNTRRAHTSLVVTSWRPLPPQQSQSPVIPKQPTPPLPHSRAKTPISDDASTSSDLSRQDLPELRHPSPIIAHQRAISMPAASSPPSGTAKTLQYSQSERLPKRPTLHRSESRAATVKKYIKRETATFFGVGQENTLQQQRRWTDRRVRMVSRCYGPVKDEFLAREEPVLEVAVGSRVDGQLQAERPDVLPGSSDIPDASPPDRLKVTLGRKDSVARLTLDGIAFLLNIITSHRPREYANESENSRSFTPDSVSCEASLENEIFFDKPTSPTSPRSVVFSDTFEDDDIDRADASGDANSMQLREMQRGPTTSRTTSTRGWKRNRVLSRNSRDGRLRSFVSGSRLDPILLDNVHDNSNRRIYGMGWLGRTFGRSRRRSIMRNAKVRWQLDDLEDHRPYFTYWVTVVQFGVFILAIFCFGFGSFGITMQSRSAQVLVTSLSLQQVDYMEPANFWIGPRAGDLIHLGAKFAPCMRIDDKIWQQINKIREKERETACCIRNDDSGCVQSSQADCSKTISTWKKWNSGDSSGRISGSVCGLDPKFCEAPASVHPFEWPDDITKWPICRKSLMQKTRDKEDEHMACDVIGHPCCMGIHGRCRITTKEYCDFVHGTFHEEASLCSQVSCLNDVCGMLPFYYPDTPDQFYRLWTSLFLHAGLIQLAITVFIQYFLMRDLEKLTGSLRIGLIYIGSGVAGNLASSIFVPYRADAGPSGSQFGLLACSIVEVLNAWPMLRNPNRALMKLLLMTATLFVIGLLPWVDNYAHLFGFVFGFLLSYALLPFISFGSYDRKKKIALIWVCLLSAAFLFICLILLFYIIPVYDCQICSYFNCIPFTADFCASQNIIFKTDDSAV